jgi:hypothetical protein
MGPVAGEMLAQAELQRRDQDQRQAEADQERALGTAKQRHGDQDDPDEDADLGQRHRRPGRLWRFVKARATTSGGVGLNRRLGHRRIAVARAR